MIYNNNLSWSISRATLLHYCNKKYFFQYYANYLKYFDKNFWLECLLLKNLKSMQMWIGEKMHILIADYLELLRKGNINELELLQIKTNLINDMDYEFQLSKQKDYSKYDKNNKFGFSEHFYNLNIDKDFELKKNELINNFDSFIQSDINKKIIDYFDHNEKIFIENPRKPDFEKMKVYIENIPELLGITVWAQPDFGLLLKEGTYLIYDWKTGKDKHEDKNYISDQLKVYAFKVLLNIGIEYIDTININAFEMFLNTNNLYGGPILSVHFTEIQDKIIQDIQIMKRFLKDEDINENVPLSIEQFSRTTNLKKCESCTFRKICNEIKEYEKKLTNNTTSDQIKEIEEDIIEGLAF